MDIEDRLTRIEAMLLEIRDGGRVQESYSTDEFARIVGLSGWTVRNYCRLGRLKATKKKSGRGVSPEWVLSHAELERFRKDGLLDG